MAEKVFNNPYFVVNGIDLSDYVKSVTLTYGAESLDKTAGATNSRKRGAGLIDWSMSLELNQDYGSGKVDATLFPLVGPGIEFTVVLRPDAASRGPDNPEYSGTGILTNYNPLNAQVGQYITTPITIESASDLSRSVAA